MKYKFENIFLESTDNGEHVQLLSRPVSINHDDSRIIGKAEIIMKHNNICANLELIDPPKGKYFAILQKYETSGKLFCGVSLVESEMVCPMTKRHLYLIEILA